MAVFEVDKEKIMIIFELKNNLKNTVNAVFEGRLTAAHLSSDVFVILEKLDALEVELIGEPMVQPVPTPAPPAPEVSAPATPPQEEQPSAPEVSAPAQPQEEQVPTQEAAPPAEEKAETPQSDQQ